MSIHYYIWLYLENEEEVEVEEPIERLPVARLLDERRRERGLEALAVLEPTGRFSVLTADTVHEAALTGVRHGDAVREQLAAGGLMAR